MQRPSRPVVTLTTLAALAVLVAGLAPGVGAIDVDGEVAVDVYPDRAPEASATNASLNLTEWIPGQRWAWNLTTEGNYTLGEVRLHEGLNVSRPKQIVPLLGGDHFVELRGQGPEDVDRPARVLNLTSPSNASSNVTAIYRLGIPGPAETNLTLHRDVDPPGYKLGEPRNVTHVGFDLKTTTSENALAVLRIFPPPGSDEAPQTHPTPRPAPLQRFPVQGLEPDTTYTYHIEYVDWSGNAARTGNHTVTTAPAPDPPEPTITPESPLPNTTVGPTDVTIRASWTSPDSPVIPSSVRVFVDKVPISSSELNIQPDSVAYVVPEPLPAREVSASVEVTNEAGGTGVAQWSFNVEAQGIQGAPLGASAALAALAGAAALARRARRR